MCGSWAYFFYKRYFLRDFRLRDQNTSLSLSKTQKNGLFSQAINIQIFNTKKELKVFCSCYLIEDINLLIVAFRSFDSAIAFIKAEPIIAPLEYLQANW